MVLSGSGVAALESLLPLSCLQGERLRMCGCTFCWVLQPAEAAAAQGSCCTLSCRLPLLQAAHTRMWWTSGQAPASIRCGAWRMPRGLPARFTYATSLAAPAATSAPALTRGTREAVWQLAGCWPAAPLPSTLSAAVPALPAAQERCLGAGSGSGHEQHMACHACMA